MKRLQQIVMTTVLLALFTPTLLQAQTVSSTAVTLADAGAEAVDLRGLYGSADVWLPLRSDWHIDQDATLTLNYIASPLLRPERATLTLVANDQPVTSLRPLADGEAHTVSATIPANLLQGEGVLLHFQSYLRLTDEFCEETNNPGQWLTILGNSALSLDAAASEATPDLADLPGNIAVENAQGTPPPVIFVLPEEPDATTLTVAAQVAARLGNTAVPFQTTSQLTQAQKEAANLVIVGQPETLPILAELEKSLPSQLVNGRFVTADSRLSEDGIVQIFNAPWNLSRKILLISGGSQAGLAQAGEAFANTTLAESMFGQFQFVREMEIEPTAPTERPWQQEITTLAQLGQADRLIRGTGTFNLYTALQRPPGWILDNGSQLTLNFSFSPVLNAQNSYIAAFINDIHVGTMRLGEGIDTTSVTFDLPVAQLNESASGERPQTMLLNLQVANFLEETSCTQTNPEAAWTRLESSSYFQTPHVYLTLPDLQAFPYPFVSDQPTGPTTLVVPNQPTDEELAQALSLAATLGQYAPADFELYLATSNDVQETSHGAHHLIILGSRERQPLLDEMLGQLSSVPAYRDPNGLYQAMHESEALLREARSPWHDERVVLLVISQTEEGAALGTETLIQTVPPVNQSGSLALITAEQPPSVLFGALDAGPNPEPGVVVREPLLPQPEPWVVITAVLIIATLAVSGLIWFSQRRALKQ